MSRRLRLEAWQRRLVSRGAESFSDRCVFALLVFLSFVYGALLWVREKLYLSGFKARYHAPVPVLSVGNLTVGGTGKTPVTDLLLKYLRGKSYTPAVVSRGYGREVASPVATVCAGDGPQLAPREAGDEPYLLARRNPEAIVVVAAQRAAGIRRALEHGADVILLDDGFQHLAVARSLDLVLLDAARPLSNGLTIPAGMLREFPTALKRASAFIVTRSPYGCNRPLTVQGRPALAAAHRLADCGWDLQGKSWALDAMRGKRIVAFCGIAAPESFFAALAERRIEVHECMAFSDHVCYDHAQLATLRERAHGADLLVTTEKDAVKLIGSKLPCPCVAIPLELTLHAGDVGLDVLLSESLLQEKELTMTLSDELLDILACPACKGRVDYDPKGQLIVCQGCRLGYPVRDDIPVMLIDEAKKVE